MGKVRLAFAERFIVLSFPIQCSSMLLLAEKSLKNRFFYGFDSDELDYSSMDVFGVMPEKISLLDPDLPTIYSLLGFALSLYV